MYVMNEHICEGAELIERIVDGESTSTITVATKPIAKQQIINERKYPPSTVVVLKYNNVERFDVRNDGCIIQQQLCTKENFQRIGSNMRSVICLLDYTDVGFEKLKSHCLKAGGVEEVLRKFIVTFFSHCALSEMALMSVQNRIVKCINAFSCESDQLAASLISFFQAEKPSGMFSLSSILQKCKEYFTKTNNPGNTKEILFFCGSICSIDDVLTDSIAAELLQEHITFSIISVVPIVHVFQQVVNTLNGIYVCIENVHETIKQLYTFATRVSLTKRKSQMLTLGFPEFEFSSTFQLCSCHAQLSLNGFRCPRCLSFMCSLPYFCSCHLLLVTASSLAACKSKVFPELTFTPLIPQSADQSRSDTKTRVCIGCERDFVSGGSSCDVCLAEYCIDCEFFLRKYSLGCYNCIKAC